MSLSSHAVIGIAVAEFVPFNPVAGFFLGFLSHFAADAIPHWDYPLRSMRRNKESFLKNDMEIGKDLAIDLSRIAFDVLLGIAVGFAVFGPSRSFLITFFAAAIGAILPDALQFVYFKIRREPLTSLQRFHHKIHTKIRIRDPLIGVPLQAIAVVIILMTLALLGAYA